MEAKMRRTIFSLLISIAWPFFLGPHCLSAQETSQLPDVWVREFVDYADDRLHIAAIDEKEVLVWQSLKADENGEPVRDSQGDTVNLEKGLLFFQGAVVTPQEHGEIFMRLGNDLATIARTNSCRIMQAHDAQRGSYSTSAGYQRLSDGGALRWFNDIAKREGWRRDFGPWRTERHTTDYNYISALERTDPNGAVVWQRVYLYFHPWWSERTGSLVNDFTHCFFYFKRGCLALVDESRVFLSFGGTRKIYRLDSNGLPKTDDKRLVVVDQGEYMRLVREVIESIDEKRITE